MNQSVQLVFSSFTPTEQLRSAQDYMKCWEQLKKILPTLENQPDDVVVCITEQGHYVLGSEKSDPFEMRDVLKAQSPHDHKGAIFSLRKARRWSSMEQ